MTFCLDKIKICNIQYNQPLHKPLIWQISGSPEYKCVIDRQQSKSMSWFAAGGAGTKKVHKNEYYYIICENTDEL